MLVLNTLWFHAVWFIRYELGRELRREVRREEGQTTAEYALVILAAAAVAVVLIAWARSSGRLPAFFDQVIDQVIGDAAAA